MDIKSKILSLVLLFLLTSCIGMSERNAEKAEDIKMQNLNQINGIYENASHDYFGYSIVHLSTIVLPEINKDKPITERGAGIEYIKATNLDNAHVRIEALNGQFQTIYSKIYTLGQDFKFENGEVEIKSETYAMRDGIVGVGYESTHFVLNDRNNLLVKSSSGDFGLALGIIPIVGSGTGYTQWDRVK